MNFFLVKMNFVYSRVLKEILRTRCKTRYCRTLTQISDPNKNQENQSNRKSYQYKALFLGVTATSVFGYYFLVNRKRKYAYTDAKKQELEDKAGQYRGDLPSFSIEEVSKHTTKKDKIWVVFKEGVYDITDFVDGHPGGDQILIAAGGSVEPFWLLYAIHNNSHVYDILEALRIGNLRKEDQSKMLENMEDPYAKDPKRHVALIPASSKPFNAELSPYLLCESFITPNELFYVRNHLPVPEVDPETYELEIEVPGQKETISFSLEELKKFPKVTITATIMCAGNRRSEMVKVKPVKGLNWGPAAIGNATWTGVRLRDVLKMAGVTEDEEKFKHVQFEGLDYDVTGNQYGASIPIWKALDTRGDVILAYEMNGFPIPPDHGYPIRVIVPGVVGARNVKWLGKIKVSEQESSSHWQQNDYKGFSPTTDWDTVDFTKSPAIQELPVISAICRPADGEAVKLENGFINVKGYAWSGGGQKIVRVDVTIDGGNTWHVAGFDEQDTALPPKHWAWTLWSIKIPVEKNTKEVEIWSKAVDSCYNTQPESFKNIWNLRGVLSNAYHRVKVKILDG